MLSYSHVYAQPATITSFHTELAAKELFTSQIASLLSLLRRSPRWAETPAKLNQVEADYPSGMGAFGKRLGLRVSMKEGKATVDKQVEHEPGLMERFEKLRDRVVKSDCT
jgi:hypothetical protein